MWRLAQAWPLFKHRQICQVGPTLSTHMVAHNYSQLQLQGVQCPLLITVAGHQAGTYIQVGKTFIYGRAWWYILLIPAPSRQREADFPEFQECQGCVERPCLNYR